jgi:hypothetical protein
MPWPWLTPRTPRGIIVVFLSVVFRDNVLLVLCNNPL